MKFEIYPYKLVEYMKNESNKYIPRNIKRNEHLKLFKRYWTTYDNESFKVIHIYFIKDYEYYSVKYSDYLSGEFSYPLNQEYIYELMIDKTDIDSIKEMVNINKSFSGAEIKYWFFINNILDNEKYENFSSYIIFNSKSVISDNKYYYVYATEINGKYVDCKLKIDYKRRR